MQIRSIVFSALLALGAVSLSACGGTSGSGEDLPECPSGGTDLTYDNFGKDFMDNYCTSCHASGSGIAQAQDIPLDSQSAIQADIDDVYEQAGGENTAMPPSGKSPTAAERDQLAEWLSCGAK